MKNKIIMGLWILIIIIGIIMMVISGFNLNSNYGKSVKIFVDFTDKFEIDEVKDIAGEVFNNQNIKVDYSDEFKKTVIINVNETSSEQLEQLENKLKDKYEEFKDKADVIFTLDVPSISLIDLVKEYIKPIVITTVITLLASMIMFRKAGIIKSLFTPILLIIGMCALYLSIIVILRIPISEYIIAIGIFVYSVSLLLSALYMKSKIEE